MSARDSVYNGIALKNNIIVVNNGDEQLRSAAGTGGHPQTTRFAVPSQRLLYSDDD